MYPLKIHGRAGEALGHVAFGQEELAYVLSCLLLSKTDSQVGNVITGHEIQSTIVSSTGLESLGGFQPTCGKLCGFVMPKMRITLLTSCL